MISRARYTPRLLGGQSFPCPGVNPWRAHRTVTAQQCHALGSLMGTADPPVLRTLSARAAGTKLAAANLLARPCRVCFLGDGPGSGTVRRQSLGLFPTVRVTQEGQGDRAASRCPGCTLSSALCVHFHLHSHQFVQQLDSHQILNDACSLRGRRPRGAWYPSGISWTNFCTRCWGTREAVCLHELQGVEGAGQTFQGTNKGAVSPSLPTGFVRPRSGILL